MVMGVAYGKYYENVMRIGKCRGLYIKFQVARCMLPHAT